jgi:uncharacterized Ntn-hydrolase superfamily protein
MRFLRPGFAAVGVLLLAATAVAGPIVHTFSIVARDPKTGEMGVAVQSHWFSVGSIVTWGEAGVGVVATQSIVDPGYGLKGLDLMRRAVSGPDALKRLLAADAEREVRQVAMLDSQGRVAAHTGRLCIAEAGQKVGTQYSVQANIMANGKVWPAMAEAFERTPGDLAERLLAALDAAQAAGGDLRGRQAQAIPILRKVLAKEPWWADLIPRLPAANQLPNDPVLIRRLVALRPR